MESTLHLVLRLRGGGGTPITFTSFPGKEETCVDVGDTGGKTHKAKALEKLAEKLKVKPEDIVFLDQEGKLNENTGEKLADFCYKKDEGHHEYFSQYGIR